MGSLARFVNHCCDPNCFTAIVPDAGHKKILLYAKRSIAVGEELTYDYKFPIEESKIVCNCGSAKCRGFMN
jgi:SET domain-containing protein